MEVCSALEGQLVALMKTIDRNLFFPSLRSFKEQEKG